MGVRGGCEDARDDMEVLDGGRPCTSAGVAVQLGAGEGECMSCGVEAGEGAGCAETLFDAKGLFDLQVAGSVRGGEEKCV